MLRWWGFSDAFRNEMVFPLTALFFGTGNQVGAASVGAAAASCFCGGGTGCGSWQAAPAAPFWRAVRPLTVAATLWPADATCERCNCGPRLPGPPAQVCCVLSRMALQGGCRRRDGLLFGVHGCAERLV